MKNKFSDKRQEAKKPVRKISSLVKLPKLFQDVENLRSLSYKRIQSSNIRAQFDETQIRLTKMHSKKLLPLQNSGSLSKDLFQKTSNNSLVSNLKGQQDTLSILKNHENKLKQKYSKKSLYQVKQNKVIAKSNPKQTTQASIDQFTQNIQTKKQVQRALKGFLSQGVLKQLIYPSYKFQKDSLFHPSWQIVDTILLTAVKKINYNALTLKEILIIYTFLSEQNKEIRTFILQRIDKKQIKLFFVKIFNLEMIILYSLLATFYWTQSTGKLKDSLKKKIEQIISLRNSVIQICFWDSNQTAIIKLDRRTTRTVSLKQVKITQIVVLVEKIYNEFFEIIKLADAKFKVFNLQQVDSINQIFQIEQTFKRRILDHPIKPYIKQFSQDKSFSLVIQPQNFLYQQDKQHSVFILREHAIEFLKSLNEYCQIIIFSKLNKSELKSFIQHVESFGIQFQAILDKKYLTLYNLKPQKNIDNLGVDLKKTIVIDPNYLNFVQIKHHKICFSLQNNDLEWNQNTQYLSILSVKLIKKIMNQMYNQINKS